MRIRLSSFYQNVNGVQIPAGEYDGKDGVLRGLAGYLVDTGHAVVIQRDPATVAESVSPDALAQADDATGFDTLTVTQLRDLAEDNFVDLAGLTRKSDIIDALVAAGIEAPEDEDGQ